MYSCDLALWPFHFKSKKSFFGFIWSMCTKFQDRCKGNTVVCWRSFLVINVMWPCQFILEYNIISASLGSMGVCLWSFVTVCAKKWQLWAKTMHCDLDLWTLKSIGYILGSWGGCMRRFVTVGLKGKQILAINRNADEIQTDTVIPVLLSRELCWGV